MFNTICDEKHKWLGHMLRNEFLMREIIERSIRGKTYCQQRNRKWKRQHQIV